MNLNQLVKTNKLKIRVGRGIGSGKGKTGGRGHKGQKSRSGVAIKSYEGGQMPLYRRLPKRGFNPISKDKIAVLNLSSLENLQSKKIFSSAENINLKALKKKKILNKKYSKLKILAKGEIKSKVDVSADFASQGAKTKIEKLGGKITLIKN
jgi:large subunit ribosomal protein L15|tara:strand:- start:47 stop:499 length:453 start_codon:yes stop_codon:yes gene_type:complete